MGTYGAERWYLVIVGHKKTMKYVGVRYILASGIDEVREKAVLDQLGNKTNLDVLQIIYLGKYSAQTIE